ncbi:MAG: MFS transporter [Chthoniobacteraceae bacterium]
MARALFSEGEMSSSPDSSCSVELPSIASPEALRQSTVLLMAVSVGVIVANIYYIQPLLAQIAQTFHLTVTHAGALAMLSQAGTAAGMFLFVPLGDKFERRGLITVLLVVASLSLLLVATAMQVWWMAAACFFMGAAAANVHVIVPFAAHLASEEQRGRVVGHGGGGHSLRRAAGPDFQRFGGRMVWLAHGLF